MGEKMAKVLFKNVNVLDCSGAAAYAGQVLVEGNRIKAVAPQGAKDRGRGRTSSGRRRGDPDAGPGRIPLAPDLPRHARSGIAGLCSARGAHAPHREERQEDARPGLHRLQQRGVGEGAARRRAQQRDQRRRFPGTENAGRQPRAGHHRRAGRRAAAAHAPRDFRDHLRRRRRVPQDRPRDGARRRGHAQDQSRRATSSSRTRARTIP